MKTPGVVLVAVLLTTPVVAAPPAPGPTPAPAETRISVDFKDVDVTDIVRMLAEVAGFQLVVDPGVSCKLTLKLHDVPWPTALDTSLRVCGLGHSDEQGVVRVAPVSKLTAEAAERRKLDEERRLDRPLVTRTYHLSYARASQAAEIARKFLSPRGQVFLDERTNTLFIQDIEE